MFLLLFCFDSFWGVLCYFFCVWGGGGVFLSMLFVSSFVFCVCSSPVVCCLR